MQPGSDEQPTNQAAAAPKPERTPYCFFKDHETKGWTAERAKDGNVVVRGKVYRSDSRYKAVLEKPKVDGPGAELWPTITVNDTGYGAPDNWWDVELAIPASAAVETVRVRCGKKVLAELSLPRAS